MSDELRFDGQVAIVTGGGGRWPSLGPAYAKLLAARGAKVVVNRLGVGWDGRGTAPANPHAVAEEIVAAGDKPLVVIGTASRRGPPSRRRWRRSPDFVVRPSTRLGRRTGNYPDGAIARAWRSFLKREE